MADSRHIAVLTGDLVNSAALGDRKIARAFQALETCANHQAGWMGAPLHFSRHRGDGWQVALARPEMALRSALAFRAALRAVGEEFDTYIAIAEGPAPEHLAADLNSHTEEVFTRSGQALDDLKKTRLPLRMVHESLGPIDAATILADRLSQGWTRAQAAALLPTLSPHYGGTDTDIARRLGKSRQAVTKSLHAAAQGIIGLALERLEKGARP
jgi:hypothetical protein